MVFELTAARLLAPTLGGSVYVWTSVIGVIIAALSLGVWLGGIMADKRQVKSDIAWLVLTCSLSISSMLVVQSGTLAWLGASDYDQRLKGVLASLILFAPTSFLIGSIGPYLAKFNVKSLESTGQSIANLDAMNALGGIFGTFLTGFLLFSILGTRGIFLALVLLLVALSWIITPRLRVKQRATFSITIGTLALLSILAVQRMTTFPVSIDTATSHYTIAQGALGSQAVRVLSTGPRASQSGMDMNNPNKMIFWYTNELANVVQVLGEPENILVLGGGAFTLPVHLARQYPAARIDSVEIDKGLTKIAKDYFYLPGLSNLNIINEDARTYINNTKNKYNIVIVDVYSDMNVPFTFMTREYGVNIADILKKDGALLVNAIGSRSGSCGQLLQSTIAPYAAQFPQAWAKKNPTSSDSNAANYVAYFSLQEPPSQLLEQKYYPLQTSESKLMTDNFAPIEPIQYRCADS